MEQTKEEKNKEMKVLVDNYDCKRKRKKKLNKRRKKESMKERDKEINKE